jgi:hypothetical protein
LTSTSWSMPIAFPGLHWRHPLDSRLGPRRRR